MENIEEKKPKFALAKQIRDVKNIFLTYPKCPHDKLDMLSMFELKLPNNIEHYVIARELHEDGSPHIHAYLRLKKVLKIRDMNYFDIKGRHPNI